MSLGIRAARTTEGSEVEPEINPTLCSVAGTRVDLQMPVCY
jgi:hypothetical protein